MSVYLKGKKGDIGKFLLEKGHSPSQMELNYSEMIRSFKDQEAEDQWKQDVSEGFPYGKNYIYRDWDRIVWDFQEGEIPDDLYWLNLRVLLKLLNDNVQEYNKWKQGVFQGHLYGEDLRYQVVD